MVLKHFCTTTYIFNETGDKCLLIKHKKLPYNLPPGGHLEENEDYFESSQREVFEELGIEASNLQYPDYLNPRRDKLVQPWTIQKYEIKPNEHYHYDLLFVALISESISVNPGEGESTDYRWFDCNNVNEIQTSTECRDNIERISKIIQSQVKKEQVQNDLYVWPRYDESTKQGLIRFTEGHDFNTWNLGNLYDSVPTKFANKMGCDYGLFASTGTAAMHAAIIGLGLTQGDEVIVPSMTFIRAATPLSHLGIIPVIADIDPHTGNIDPQSIQANITEKTKAVVVVHMWGVPADCYAIRKICDENNILMIEDFSQAHFSMCNDKFVGSYGDVGFASLQRKKMISVGEGGLITTNNKDLYARLLHITSPGSFDKAPPGGELDFSGYGLNMRMNPFAAVVAQTLYDKIDETILNRQKSVEALQSILVDYQDKFELPKLPQYAQNISWYSYKPRLIRGSLDELKSKSLWKFSSFGYPPIADHLYWDKDEAYFPFSQQNIKPQIRHELKGHVDYLEGRITLNIPTVDAAYWSPDNIEKWRQAIV